MRRVLVKEDVERWVVSPAFRSLVQFMTRLGVAAEGHSNRDVETIRQTLSSAELSLIVALETLISRIDALVTEVEPLPMAHQRYGNRAFRTFVERLRGEARALIEACGACGVDADASCMEATTDASPEVAFLCEVLVNCFGNGTRIDYGTGHELFFLILVLVCCSVYAPRDELSNGFHAVLGVQVVGQQYIRLVRRIQDRYSLEPAGSHGVWGLDDYQFFPFFIGSAQLIDRETVLSPDRAIDLVTINNDALRDQFLYVEALRHIHALKTRGNSSLLFAHHSPLLYDISGIPTWRRIHEGLGRMYIKEVLSKFPVVQHLLFASVFPF